MSTAFDNTLPHQSSTPVAPLSAVPSTQSDQSADPAIIRAQLAVIDPETPWPERTAALETYSKAHFTLEAPGVPVSNERLAFEAAALGLELRKHDQCFRLDTRPPEIIFAEGFMPRDDKPSGSLLSHLEAKSGNMVSGTSEESNPTVVWGLATHHKLAPVGENQAAAFNAKMAAQYEADVAKFKELLPDASPWHFSLLNYTAFSPGNVDAGVAEFQEIAQLLAKLPPEMRVVPPEIASRLPKTPEAFLETAYNVWGGLFGDPPQIAQEFTLYEYRLKDIDGVEFSADFKDFSFTDQREVTFSHAQPQQIDAVRELKVRATFLGFIHGSGMILNRENVEIEAGDWISPNRD